MENITYNVRIYKMEVYNGKKVTTYTVRWKTGSEQWKEPFRKRPQAISFESELRAAANKGEAFDVTTGRPVAWGRAAADMSWYDFCVSYVDMKWKGASGKHRANTAWALVTVMPAMLACEKGKPADKKIRTALRRWAFNTKNRADCPDDAAQVLKWLARNTKPVSALADPKVMRAVLDRAATLLDGSLAAPSTVQRNRAILHNACEYAVELNTLRAIPSRPSSGRLRNPRPRLTAVQSSITAMPAAYCKPSGNSSRVVRALPHSSRCCTTPAYARRRLSTCVAKTSPFRGWSGTSKPRAGRSRRMIGESCTFALPHPRSERSGPTTAPAARCGA
ncbi:Uncharacterised protein [Mycobacterium tuberculosis]|nr:Uncharacterised protein [Mycobacterium tuberculosis]